MRPVQVYQALLATCLGTYVVCPTLFSPYSVEELRYVTAVGVLAFGAMIIGCVVGDLFIGRKS